MLTTQYSILADRRPDFSKELCIALVSDLHERNGDGIIPVLKAHQPDLICIPGDTFERMGDVRLLRDVGLLRKSYMVSKDLLRAIHRQNHSTENARRFLTQAVEIAPVFMSLGNHDLYLTDEDRRFISSCGITLFGNGFTDWKGIRIGGMSTCNDRQWLDRFCEGPSFKLLLCHRPEYYGRYLKKREIDLILSGHAHGGQIRFRGKGVFAPGQGFFPEYHHGIYDGRLVVSAGCANTVSIPRWGNPPEIVFIRVKKHLTKKESAVLENK